MILKYYIYLITNKLNNKKYIGQTINFEKRMKEHIYGRNSKKNCLIDRALKKYGKNNFTFEILDITDSQENIDYLEKYYIKKLNCIKPNGYNILKGGRKQQGSWNMKTVQVFDLEGNFIQEYESSEQLEIMSNGKYKSRGIRQSCKTKTHLYKDILVKYKYDNIKIEKYIKPKSSRIKSILQYDMQGNFINKYDSITEASKLTKTSRTSILGCASGKYKKANNYIWLYEENIYELEERIKNIAIKKCRIIQYDENYKEIARYNSCSEAQRKLGLKEKAYKQIFESLKTKRKSYGYYWCKEEDNPVPSLEEEGQTTIERVTNRVE